MSAINFVRLIACACVLVAAACSSAAESPPGRPASTVVGQPNRTVAPNVPGAPQKTDAGNVPTAPITIPPIFDKQGRPIDEVRSEVASEIEAACGGDLCVNLTVAAGSNDSLTQCEYETSDPASHPDEAFVLERGSTLTLLTGSQPCETTTTETTEETTEPETTEETTTEQPTTNVEPTG
jgi:hypothetical protein